MSDIFNEITSRENLFASWREFRRGKRERADVQAFERHVEDGIFRLHEELRAGSYRHGSYQQFRIFDPKARTIHKASVRDRLVHHAVVRVLQPICERSFIFDSYSCREEKGTHAAVRRLEVFARKVSRNFTAPCWALKFDIRKFFDSVDHAVLLRVLGRTLACPQTEGLLAEIVGSFSVPRSAGGGEPHRPRTTRRGFPSGA